MAGGIASCDPGADSCDSIVRAWIRTYVIALGLAVSATVGGLFAVNVVIDRKIDAIDRVPNLDLAENTDPGEPANFLLIGSDTRAFIENPEQEEAFGDAETQTGQRSDTLMVVHVDPENREGLLVSFPRDLLVDIPGLGRTKINAAYNEGGAQKVIDTLDQEFGIPIQHYLEIDFASFEGIVNAVGGVPVYFTAPARDETSGFDIPLGFGWQPGCYELDGGQALAYVRSRNYQQLIDDQWVEDPTADVGRIERQQAFMRRLASEAVARSLSNPLAANRIADESLADLKVDEDLSRSDIFKLIQAFRRVDPNKLSGIETVTFPFSPAGNQADLLPDVAAAEPLLQRLRELTPAPDAPDGPAPLTIRVRVLNGSGSGGVAAETSTALGEHGFQDGGVGNNPDGIVEKTEIRYRPGSEDKAEVVRFSLGGTGRLIEDESIVEADVLLVVGEDFEGVAPPPSAAPTDPAATAEPAPSAPPSSGADEPPAPQPPSRDPAEAAAQATAC